MIKVQNQSISGEKFMIGLNRNEAMSSFAKSTFEDSIIEMIEPNYLLIMCSVFIRTSFNSAKKGIDLNWSGSMFSKCNFSGSYYDTRFGISGDDLDDCNNQAGLENCDFSNASLHLCSFYNCDPTTLKFPRWPHITVLHPRKNEEDWRNIPFPSAFRVFQDVITYSENSKAATIHWPTYAQEENDTTDPESIRQLLVGKDYIVI